MNDTSTNQTLRYDTDTTTAEQANERHSLQTYVSDMLALERHINAPFSKQRVDADVAKYPQVASVVTRLKDISDNHIGALESRLKAIGGHEISPLKSAWASLLGAGAAAIGSVRKTRISKNLRDDYTALSLACVSYTMLHATATGLGDNMTAALAERHLSDITPLIMLIGRAMPAVVLAELQDDGENVNLDAASKTERVVDRSWSHQA